jgi:2-amino-1-hydroxyethylphosphonate dioxygenase (glycine-forming)
MSPATAIFALYRRQGHQEYIGEPVSQLEHACQSGQLALSADAPPEMVLAAFLHDIGHLCAGEDMAGYGKMRHEQLGADFLRMHGVPERIAHLVERHVDAKRYLTARFPEYASALSDASRETLRLQGGPMSEKEAATFEQDPDFQAILQLRRWDEAAKEQHLALPDLLFFEKMLDALMQA